MANRRTCDRCGELMPKHQDCPRRILDGFQVDLDVRQLGADTPDLCSECIVLIATTGVDPDAQPPQQEGGE